MPATTKPDIGADHPGYPAGWRIYLNVRKKAAEHFKFYPEGTVKPSWDRTCTKEEWGRECRKALHDRINARARECWRNYTTQRETDWLRDQRILHDFLKKPRKLHRGSGFVSQDLRSRFPEVQEELSSPFEY